MGLSTDDILAEDAKKHGENEEERKGPFADTDGLTNAKKKPLTQKKPKQKKKKFRYESKTERKITARRVDEPATARGGRSRPRCGKRIHRTKP